MTTKLPSTAGGKASMPSTFDGEIYSAVGRYARSAVLYAFEQMGGADRLTGWAEENPDEFYTKLFPKIIARESEVTHHKTVDQLMDVIDGDYVVDGEFDDEEPIDLPAAKPPLEASFPIKTTDVWNASESDFEDQGILSAVDYVDFEE